MKKINLILANELSSIAFGEELAKKLLAPLVLTFSGEIGAGKTTLIRALLTALGVKPPIKSPTFSLVESYQCNLIELHHFDLYRINDSAELEFIGFRDYFHNNSICFIEWPKRAPNMIHKVDLKFTITVNPAGRLLHIEATSAVGEKIFW